MALQLLFGFLAALVIAWAAYRAHSLNRSGAWGAVLVGTVIFGLGGWKWAILLLAFFITSSALTRLFGARKAGLDEKFEKGGRRDIGQVLANGWTACLFAGFHFFLPGAAWTWIGFAAALAAVNADTWSTELGVLSPTLPRLITNGKPVEKGTSGAVSPLGTLSAVVGAALIALLAGWLRPTGTFWPLVAGVTVAGAVGALFDSLLGATVQAIFWCPRCRKETERHPRHTCGTETTQVRGWKWLNNDLVNLACATLGALIGLVLP